MKKLIAFAVMGVAIIIAVCSSDFTWYERLGGLAVIGGFVFAFVKYGSGKEVGEDIRKDLEDKFGKK